MKWIVASGLVALLNLSVLSLSDCEGSRRTEQEDAKHDTTSVILLSEVGDGIYKVGTTKGDINSGVWQPEEEVSSIKGCVWFVSPNLADGPAAELPSYTSRPPGRPKIKLKDRQGFTTSGCGLWKKVGQ